MPFDGVGFCFGKISEKSTYLHLMFHRFVSPSTARSLRLTK
jgi:hypothetical protein